MGEINAHKQKLSEALRETWEMLRQKLKQCPNLNITDEYLKEIFYRSFNFFTKPAIDASYGGLYMARTFQEATIILDQVSKNNWAWYTRDSDSTGFIFEISVEQKLREEEQDQDMAHIKTKLDLLTKRLLSRGLEKVIDVGNANLYDGYAFELHEEAKFYNIQRGLQTYNTWNKGWNYK